MTSAAFLSAQEEFERLANPANVAGMTRFGINAGRAYGVPMPQVRAMAKRLGHSAALARELWADGAHEMRILAALVHEPAQFTAAEADSWAAGFDSWDVCDQVCLNLVWKTAFAWDKVACWSADEREFVRRAAFSLLAVLAVHDKKASNKKFIKHLRLVVRHSRDERNMVKKAVNWALRQIGKRNLALNAEAVRTAREILALDTRPGNWIARDALRELTSGAVARWLVT